MKAPQQPLAILAVVLAHVLSYCWMVQARGSGELPCFDLQNVNACPRNSFAIMLAELSTVILSGTVLCVPMVATLKRSVPKTFPNKESRSVWSIARTDRGAECSNVLPCTPGTFCNFESVDVGICQECLDVPAMNYGNNIFQVLLFECSESGLSERGAKECSRTCFAECSPQYEAYALVDKQEFYAAFFYGKPIAKAVSGPLVDCGASWFEHMPWCPKCRVPHGYERRSRCFFEDGFIL